jgi:hypothetical protein
VKILIEHESYPIDVIEKLFDNTRFYSQNGDIAIITSVGYYHSFTKNSLVLMLPKVFMRDREMTVFDCTKYDLIDMTKANSIKHNVEYNWIRQLSVHFYNSLIEYKRRVVSTSIVYKSETFELNTNLSEKDYSYLDLYLSFINFYKKSKDQILFKHIELLKKQAIKPKWEKTIRKATPIFTKNSVPIYLNITNKKKVIDKEEELITYFYSILYHFKKEHDLVLNIDKSYSIIKGGSFKRLCRKGSSKLRKIKYRYFNDTMRKMYGLCELYFNQFDNSGNRKTKEEYLSVNKYETVFENMVDKLFSDDLCEYDIDGVTVDKLKNNKDGKIIDHIYDYKSLIDTSDVFYIGDSKYYKSGSNAGSVSKYKQFTYAKNVIQFNIDLFYNNGERFSGKLRYRDDLTEGYNISPNFFIYGFINKPDDYSSSKPIKKGVPIPSLHFKHRLFDRDTLFVHSYELNFLFVLRAYTVLSAYQIKLYRDEIKERFRSNFVNFFNDKKQCNYEFFQSTLNSIAIESFVNNNFKMLNGKCFYSNDGKLIIAKHIEDEHLIIDTSSFEPFVFK